MKIIENHDKLSLPILKVSQFFTWDGTDRKEAFELDLLTGLRVSNGLSGETWHFPGLWLAVSEFPRG